MMQSIQFKIFEATPGCNLLVLPTGEFTIAAVTNEALDICSLTRAEIVGATVVKFFNRIEPSVSDVESLQSSLRKVVVTKGEGKIQYGESRISIAPVLADDGELSYLLLHVADNAANRTQPGLKPATELQNAYKFFLQAPVIIGYVRGDDYLIDFANKGLLKAWNAGPEVIGKSLFAVFPELAAQGIKQLLDNVRTSGKPFYAYEFPIDFIQDGVPSTLYFDFIYQPYYEDSEKIAAGIISVGYDVTEKVKAKKLYEETHRKLTDLANAMPAIVWISDPQGRPEFLNHQWYEFTGLSAEQSLGDGWAKVIHPDDVDECLSAWRAAVEAGASFEIQMRYRRMDGIYIWHMVRSVPVRQGERIVAWYGTSIDIEKQKLLESELAGKVTARTAEVEDKSRLLDSILKNSSNGISVSRLIFDERGEVIDAQTILANAAAVSYIGLPEDLYLSKPASFFDPQIMSSAYGKSCAETIRTGQPFITHYYVEYSERWLEVTVSKMDGQHLIHIFTDVTQIKNSQLKLEKLLDDLKFSNANLEQFAYAASHDLKEPIRKVQFYANRLFEDLKDSLTGRQLSALQKIESTANRMQALVADLLEYSQAERGSFEQSEINLNAVVKTVLQDLELEVEKRQADIKVGNLPSVLGNQRQLHQMFQNLISNALKYARDGVTPKISIAYTAVVAKDLPTKVAHEFQGRQYHLIEVVDNGIGFEQAHAENIFKVFTRLHPGEAYRGSGVGLSIVKKVAESHEGFVWAESEVGKGSTFRIALPVRTTL